MTVIGLLYHPQEGLLELGHEVLGLPHFPHNFLILVLDLRNGLLDEFDLMVLMSAVYGTLRADIGPTGETVIRDFFLTMLLAIVDYLLGRRHGEGG